MENVTHEIANRTKARAVEDWVRGRIADGVYSDGAKLPSDYDLARQLGVAYMTVRSALEPLVREGLLQRVRGKGTFVARRAEGTVTTRSLALIVPSLSALWNVTGLDYFPGILQGFCAEATRLGYEPAIISRASGLLTSRDGELLHDGAACAGAAALLVERSDFDAIDTLRTARVPVVAIHPYHGRRIVTSVQAKQSAGVASAVAHLAGLGHERIAFLGGPNGNLAATARLSGFRAGMEIAGLRMAYAGTESGEYTDKSGAERTRLLLESNEPPTAIVTAGDLIAAGAIQAAAAAGLTVPADLSIVGFGDFTIAQLLQPALTTVRLPLTELGASAAAALHAIIGGETQQRTI